MLIFAQTDAPRAAHPSRMTCSLRVSVVSAPSAGDDQRHRDRRLPGSPRHPAAGIRHPGKDHGGGGDEGLRGVERERRYGHGGVRSPP